MKDWCQIHEEIVNAWKKEIWKKAEMDSQALR